MQTYEVIERDGKKQVVNESGVIIIHDYDGDDNELLFDLTEEGADK